MAAGSQRIDQIADVIAANIDSHWRESSGKADPCNGYVAQPKDQTLPAFLEEAFKVSIFSFFAQ
jgi:hypothetical protein